MTGWKQFAACRGMDTALFYPSTGDAHGPALAVCEQCPVIVECRDAGRVELFGVWGGLWERERARQRLARRTGRAA